MMISGILKEAVTKDIEKDYLSAVQLYEKSVKEEGMPLDAVINLAFLYWQFSDYAFNTNNKIPKEYVQIGADLYSEVLDKGLVKYPDVAELHFWKKYILHRMIFDDLTEKEVKEIIDNYNNTSLVPYFFLYLTDEEKYNKERGQLLEYCNKRRTAKNLYIIALLE